MEEMDFALSGYCRCCAAEIDAVRRLRGEAIDPDVTIICRSPNDDGEEDSVIALLMPDGSASVMTVGGSVLVAPAAAAVDAIAGCASAIDRVIVSRSATEESRRLAGSLRR